MVEELVIAAVSLVVGVALARYFGAARAQLVAADTLVDATSATPPAAAPVVPAPAPLHYCRIVIVRDCGKDQEYHERCGGADLVAVRRNAPCKVLKETGHWVEA